MVVQHTAFYERLASVDEEYFLQSTKPGVFEYTFSKLSKDVELASKSAATVVILMGMHKLDEIISIFQQNRNDDLPIAIIQNGTKNSEQKVIGTINTITKLVAEKNISSPAIIVIGEVVRNTSSWISYFQEHFEDEFIFQNLNL